MLLVRFVATLLIGFMTAGCNYSWIPFTYRPDIHQGNVITQEMVDQLKPLLVDPFHDERWDYLYSNQPGNEVRVQKNVTLIFKHDQLVQLQGDFRPGTLPSIEMKKDSSITVPTIPREKTLTQKFLSLFGVDDDD